MYLNCKTWFSFHYGTIGTEALVNMAAERGIQRLALTNINNTCDAWDFVDFCEQKNIKPVLGAEIRNGDELLYILLAKNNDGFESINRFLSEHRGGEIPFPARSSLHQVACIYPYGSLALNALGADEYLGVQPTEINKLFGLGVQNWSHKLVVRQPVTFQDQTHFNAHRLLRAIDKNIILSKQQPAHIAGKHETMISPAELAEAFKLHPAIIDNTIRLLENCSASIEFHTDKTKKVYSAGKDEDRDLLSTLAMEGMLQRYGRDHHAALERVKHELEIIGQMGFNAYFLITWDIVQYARSRGFFFVGRGSGANSIVAYCLQITDVDPLELDLYFERFLNPHRSSPPDFDLDFSWKDRDEIIRYIFSRHGHDHVCLLGSYATFQTKAILRELGKVFGLPKEEIDQLDSGNLKDDSIRRQIHFYGNLIRNFPDHMSIHAGGMLISDSPIYRYSATGLPPKNFAVSQIDMFVADKIGLFKLDILSQRGLGHIRETIDLVQQNQNIQIDIHDVGKFKKDPLVAERIRNADSVGCFYIESPGMRQLLKKMECNDYLGLVAASSIIRPGVAQSGMMKQYIHRYHHPQDFEYLHPKMKELLEETYGIMVYQEDVIKVAHFFAGLDLGEADVLRRAMSGKYRGRKQFEEIREKFFRNCDAFGYEPAVTAEVWRQIESFGGFSFSKAHSASFAVESYQSAYLKTYFPREFLVAVINNFGGFYSRELYFQELKKTGITLHPPCLNHSTFNTSINGQDVYIGFVHVQALEEALVRKTVEERKRSGPFLSLADFIDRINPGLEQLNLFIRVGAFQFTGKEKKELMWEANFLQKKTVSASSTGFLFREAPVEFKLPPLPRHPLDDALDEIDLLGFPLGDVFDLADTGPENYLAVADLAGMIGKTVLVLGYLITSKTVQTARGPMHFHSFKDADGNWFDAVFFPDVSKYYPVTGKGFYAMKGKVVSDFNVYSIEVTHAKKIGYKDRKAAPNVRLKIPADKTSDETSAVSSVETSAVRFVETETGFALSKTT